MMQKRRINIAWKIREGYIIIMAMVLIVSIVVFIVLRQSIKIDKEVSQLYQPTIQLLKDVEATIKRSDILANDWIYQTNTIKQNNYILTYTKEIPDIQSKLHKFSKKWQSDESRQLQKLIPALDSLTINLEKIPRILQSIEDYDDDTKVDLAIQILENEINTRTKSLTQELEKLNKKLENQSLEYIKEKYDSFALLEILQIICTLIVIFVGIYASNRSIQSIIKPLNSLRRSLLQLEKGELQTLDIHIPNDEVGEMIKACNVLVQGLKQTTFFALEIEKGNFNNNLEALSGIEVLNQSLIKMRDSLLIAQQRENLARWSAEGQAMLSDIMRNSEKDEKQLSEQVLSNLLKYVEATVGGVYLLDEAISDQNDIYLDLVATYAYNPTHLHDKRLHIHQSSTDNLIGQCFLSRQLIQIKDKSSHPTTINLGIYQTIPSHILIVPIVFNDEVYGVLELAAISILDEYKIEFVLKIVTRFASTLAVYLNEKEILFAQEKIINLQRQYNDELEEKVSQRTKEIEEKNHEITRQNEELHSQRQLLESHNEELRTARLFIEMQKNDLEAYNENLEIKISERTKEVSQMNKELLQQNTQLEQYAYIVAHNIRAPVARIKGLGNIIQNLVKSDEERNRMIELMIKTSEDIDRVITDLNRLLEIKKGGNEIFEFINLSHILDKVTQTLDYQIKTNKVIIKENFEETPQVYAISPYIESILYNLIGNAIKYRSPNRDAVIEVSSQSHKNWDIITVVDNGLGIDLEKNRDKIFKLYNRFHTHVEGKGMGLHLLKTQIEAMGGKIRIQSELEEGTSFIIFLKKNVTIIPLLPELEQHSQ
jgi:signal transduction histidine kinase/HAMP domain-containing protein